MSQKIFTYILGAGASYNILPLVKSFPDRLDKFIEFIRAKFPESLQYENRITFKIKDPKESLIKDFQALIKNIRNHSSIDTFARKLYLKKENEQLLKLKSLVDLYLTIEQLANGIDPRYDAFFAALLQEDGNSIQVPNNIRIITWNYDFQLELSLSSFMQITDFKQFDNRICIQPSYGNIVFTQDCFSIIKINGTAMGFLSADNKFRKNGFDPTKIKDEFLNDRIIDPLQGFFFDYFNKVYLSYPDSKKEPTILYSWEKDSIAIESRKYAKEIMEITDYLIIIGYSFPTFNRMVDRDLLQALKKRPKIFIQAPEKEIDSVVQRFEALSNSEFIIKKITQTDEFHIPFEYK